MQPLRISYPPAPVDPDPLVSVRRRMLWLVGMLDQVEAEALRLLEPAPFDPQAREMLQAVFRARRASKQGLSAFQLFGESELSRVLALVGQPLS